jgi:hypothetical protein
LKVYFLIDYDLASENSVTIFEYKTFGSCMSLKANWQEAKSAALKTGSNKKGMKAKFSTRSADPPCCPLYRRE